MPNCRLLVSDILYTKNQSLGYLGAQTSVFVAVRRFIAVSARR
jgi:hypothetical protein